MKLVILDRDGVLNPDCEEFIASPEEWEPLPGALEAVARLNHAGFHVVIATDQSGLGRGLFDVASLNAIHSKLHKRLAACGGRVDAVFYCPHGTEETCTCRLPLPGLFVQIGERWGIELQGLPVCASRAPYLSAAAAVGCAPHLVWASDGPLPEGLPQGTQVHANLAAFADVMMVQPPWQDVDSFTTSTGTTERVAPAL
jgi:D-glycero-D-manno-heptose 1,7-bisphosphate phosphatase